MCDNSVDAQNMTVMDFIIYKICIFALDKQENQFSNRNPLKLYL